MSKKAKDKDPWRALKEQGIDKCFKLGSVFFWPQENHYFIYLGLDDEECPQRFCFFVSGSSQTYWDKEDNFPIVPEDFRTAKEGTKRCAFAKTTYFLFEKYTQYRYEMEQLRELYLNGKLDYKFNLKANLPKAYERLIAFIQEQLPPIYVKRFLSAANVLPDCADQ